MSFQLTVAILDVSVKLPKSVSIFLFSGYRIIEQASVPDKSHN
jgi:hypothetical protein